MNNTSRNIPFRHSITVKTWLGIFFLSFIPLVALGIYSVSVLSTTIGELLIKNSIQAFQQVKTEVELYLSSYEDIGNLLKNDERITGPSCPDAARALSHVKKQFEFIEKILVCDAHGKVLADSAGVMESSPVLTDLEKGFLARKEKIVFGNGVFHYVSDLSNGNFLVMSVSFLKLRKALEGMAFGTSFQFFLVGRDGSNILGVKDFPIELIGLFVKKQYGGYDIHFTKSTRSEKVGIVLPVLKYGLKIVILQESSEVYAVVHLLRSNMFFTIAVVGVLAFIFGSFFSLRITKPIILIADKAQQVAEGNLKVSVPSRRQDEIGFLAKCFNLMTQGIRKKVFELSSLYRVSSIINNATSFQGALDGSLAHLVVIFLAQRGSIMLYDEKSGELVLKSIRTFGQLQPDQTSELTPYIRMRTGEGIGGRVLEKGKPILCANCHEDELFKPYPEGTAVPPPKSLLCVPLLIKGNAVGIINLVDRADRQSEGFSTDDMEVLATIASQMAMSIENAKLHELAITDGLTGLFIHRFFQIKLDDEIQRSRRYGEPVSLILFDIDHFKAFNDNYGHVQGDSVLREVARILKATVRTIDLPCRYGGEEFAVILPHTALEQAEILGERLRKAVAEFAFPAAEKSLHVTISLGIAEYPATASEKLSLIQNADKGLYQSKDKGRNCLSIYRAEKTG